MSRVLFFMGMNCLLCKTPTKHIFDIDKFEIFECPNCTHRSTVLSKTASHVNDTYTDDYFYAGGAGYPNYLNERDILIRHGRYYGNLISKEIGGPGKVLDVGAAAGFILKGMMDCGWKGIGLEVNSSMAAYGRNNLGVNLQVGSIENYETTETFNVINFIQVIAHIINPLKVIKKASDMLIGKGYILI